MLGTSIPVLIIIIIIIIIVRILLIIVQLHCKHPQGIPLAITP